MFVSELSFLERLFNIYIKLMLSLCTCQNTKLYDSDCKMSYLSDRCLCSTAVCRVLDVQPGGGMLLTLLALRDYKEILWNQNY